MFKEGDKIRQKEDCSGAIAGEIYELTYGDKDGDCKDELWAWKSGKLDLNRGDGCTCQNKWELLTNEKTIMQKLNLFMRTLLDKDLQTLIKANLVNGDLKLTEDGLDALHSIFLKERKEDLVKIALEIIFEEEKKK